MITDKPIALIDSKRCRQNIQSMAGKLDQLGITYRPHFKTHQSAEIGNWYRDAGVTKITVSSPAMASYFIQNGWNDITIGFPATRSQFKAINELSGMAGVSVFINDPVTAQYFAENSSNKLNVFIEIDAGFNRSGVPAGNSDLIENIYHILAQSPVLNFYGFYVHDGRTYSARGEKEVSKVINPVIAVLNELKKEFPEAKVCMGDTPSCSLLRSFPGIDELSPGNNVFYDLMQLNIGSCSMDDVAMAVACPVAQVKADEGEAIIYGGAVHFSKDRIEWNGRLTYGAAIELKKNSLGNLISGSYLMGVSQEHGQLKGDPDWISGLTPGDTICILPVHSCLSANLFDHYQTVNGNRIEKRILS
jgi:D-serine deaminase-like pyridoxal phosphate-dependent protein